MFRFKIINPARLLLLLIFFCLADKILLPQIPINGFCKYESLSTEKNFSEILALNFNGDSYNDIALFGAEKGIVTYQGEASAKFSKPRTTKSPIEISSIIPINKNIGTNIFAFISRKNRRVGLLQFSASGTLKIITEKKLDGYPENLVAADINRNGKDEILISGCSFEGISVFVVDNNKLIEKRIIPKGLFSKAVFIDVNNDGYQDIAAVDLLSRTITFYIYYSLNTFKEIRKIYVPDKIIDLQATDFNLDGYKDLTIATTKQTQIIFGDAYSSFNKILYVPAGKPADRFIERDFNGDGLIDFVYLNKESSSLSILFAKDQNNFYPEVTYIRKNNLVEIIPFYSRFVNGLLAYSKDGKFYLIDRLKVLEDNVHIAIGSSPSCVKYFDAGNDKIYDLCYYNRDSKSLDMLIRNTSGIPSKFYSIKLQEQYDNITIDDKDASKKYFYCYSSGKRLVEIISVDFKSNAIIEEKLYTLGPIDDFKITRSSEDERARIYVLSNRWGELYLSIINYKDFRYASSNSQKLAFNVIKAKLIIEYPLAIFYWESGKNSITFNKLIVNNDLKPEHYDFKFPIQGNKPDNISLITGDIFNNNKNNAVSFINNSNSRTAVITSENTNYKVSLNEQFDNLNMAGDRYFSLSEIRINGINKLIGFDYKESFIVKLDIINKKRDMLFTRLVKTEDLESYFIKNMSFKNYHLVYIDKLDNCITIKEIS